jgi:hypothetical protein
MQIDALAEALTQSDFLVEKDVDGSHLEILDYRIAAVLIEVDEPGRTSWPDVWDGCTLSIGAADDRQRCLVTRDLRRRLPQCAFNSG